MGLQPFPEGISLGRVLVVDDEVAIAEMVGEILRHHGYQAVTCSSGAEALEHLNTHKFDMVVTDVRMPRMSGLELLERIKSQFPSVYVILMSGTADVPVVIRAMRNGASDMLVKPFTLDELRERLMVAFAERERALDQSHEHDHFRNQLETLKHRYSELADGAIVALTSVLDVKHSDTREHSERVASLAAGLADSMELSEEMVQAIYLAGLLHDLGKVAVDTALLEKTGRLETEERVAVQIHPTESARIVSSLPLSRVTQEAILHHHERFGGGGYPAGLVGADIPLGARILAICDAYDAMTAGRPYQPGISPDEAVHRIQDAAGDHFDPELASRFVAMLSAVA